jgi:hypothetical protein
MFEGGGVTTLVKISNRGKGGVYEKGYEHSGKTQFCGGNPVDGVGIALAFSSSNIGCGAEAQVWWYNENVGLY